MINITKRAFTGILFAGIILGVLKFGSLQLIKAIHIMLFIGILYEWLFFFVRRKPQLLLITPLYPIAPMVIMLLQTDAKVGSAVLLGIYMCAFVHDSCSYVFGQLFGKNSLLPAISPNKTWEGFLGGFLGVYALLYSTHYLNLGYKGLLISLAITVAATMGDLFESLLKRYAGLKDSGNLLPGHGGLLDRMDSVFFLAILARISTLYWR